jgi:acyl-CoA synthetase (AMP-forming)/AMP-acid ligase II
VPSTTPFAAITGIVIMVPEARSVAPFAHVTVLAPFGKEADPTPGELAEVEDFFAEEAPFDFRLTEVCTLPDGTRYLSPDPASRFSRLTHGLHQLFPEYPPYEGQFDIVVPHLTIPETLNSYDLSHVKVVAASGSAMPGNLAIEWMDQFGDTLYNIYGSTEVAWASVAQPRDMRAAPGTAGKPPVNTIVKLFDPEGKEVPVGETGRIFVGNSMLFEGYTGGGHKESIDGLMSSGDVGRFDAEGRLFVEGRDDEMIVSGGENVFPKEVEDCLARHEAVVEVAAIGVDDDEFGTRLRAFVVRAEGAGVTEDELREHVKSNLARYKVPRDFVFLSELPRNATGKILKRELTGFEV